MEPRIEIRYLANQDIKTIQNNNIFMSENKIKNGVRIVVSAKLPENGRLISAKLILPRTYYKDEKFFMNGYQSWSSSKEVDLFDKEKGIYGIAKLLDWKYHFKQYGDYNFYKYTKKIGVIHSHKYTYFRNNNDFEFYGALSEKEGFTIFETDINRKEITIYVDVNGLDVEANKERKYFDIIKINSDEKTVFDEYFDFLDIKPIEKKKLRGFTSWYNYYQDINEEIILKNIENFKEISKKDIKADIYQIDDGYETYVGDWLDVDEDKFPNGLENVINAMENNFTKGLWLAPFVCERKSKLFKNHKNWLLRDDRGKIIPAGANWSGFYALDIYNIEFRQYLKKVFDYVFDVWKFDLVKLDFLYACCLGDWHNKTRAEVMLDGMKLLRELCRDKLILGCGVPISSSFGLVDYCRIGCDMSLDWNGGIIRKLILSEYISTLDAIENSIGRRQLDGRAFMNDPDVFLLRNDNIKMNANEKFTLAVTNALYGSVLFTSDDFSKYESESLFIQLKEIWKLSEAEVTSTEILKENVYKSNFILDGKEKYAIINSSEKDFVFNNDCINKRNVKLF